MATTWSVAPGDDAQLGRAAAPDVSLVAIAAAFLADRTAPPVPLAGGLINDTYAVGDSHVLQRLHPVFATTVNDDIAAITPVLRERFVPAPAIVPLPTGEFALTIEAGAAQGVWRLLTRLPGCSLVRGGSPEQVAAAAGLLARFHTAVASLDHRFAFARPGAHDTDGHIEALSAACAGCVDHRLHQEVEAIARELSERWATWAGPRALPRRIVHGDPKLTNFLFADQEAPEVTGIVDLDTMAHGTIDVECGDALRSWCNLRGEDETADLSLDHVGAAVHGYAQAAHLSGAEWDALVPGLERIALELAARFARDALQERYFRWDPARAPGHGEHNLLRAQGQLSLAREVAARRSQLTAIVATARRGAPV